MKTFHLPLNKLVSKIYNSFLTTKNIQKWKHIDHAGWEWQQVKVKKTNQKWSFKEIIIHPTILSTASNRDYPLRCTCVHVCMQHMTSQSKHTWDKNRESQTTNSICNNIKQAGMFYSPRHTALPDKLFLSMAANFSRCSRYNIIACNSMPIKFAQFLQTNEKLPMFLFSP